MKPYAKITTPMGTMDVYGHDNCDCAGPCDCHFPIEIVPHFACAESAVRALEGKLFQGCDSGQWDYGAYTFERLEGR